MTRILARPAVLLALFAADRLTKLWALDRLAPMGGIPLLPFFHLTYVENTGAAFGMLAGAPTIWRQVFFVGVALAALGVLVYSYRQFREQGRIFAHAIGLIAGGAVGNLIDRLRFGAVVDFLDFYVGTHHWPAFNVADSAITIGVGLFILGSILSPGEDSEKLKAKNKK